MGFKRKSGVVKPVPATAEMVESTVISGVIVKKRKTIKLPAFLKNKKLGLVILVLLLVTVSALGIIKSRQLPPPGTPERLIKLKQKEINSTEDKTAKSLSNVELANRYALKGDTKSALAAYLEADELTPNDPRILGNIGRTYFQLKDKANSIKYFERTLELANKDTTGQYKSIIPLWTGYLENARKDNFNEPDLGYDSEKGE